MHVYVYTCLETYSFYENLHIMHVCRCLYTPISVLSIDVCHHSILVGLATDQWHVPKMLGVGPNLFKPVSGITGPPKVCQCHKFTCAAFLTTTYMRAIGSYIICWGWVTTGIHHMLMTTCMFGTFGTVCYCIHRCTAFTKPNSLVNM